jgi:hypothetical protein
MEIKIGPEKSCASIDSSKEYWMAFQKNCLVEMMEVEFFEERQAAFDAGKRPGWEFHPIPVCLLLVKQNPPEVQ